MFSCRVVIALLLLVLGLSLSGCDELERIGVEVESSEEAIQTPPSVSEIIEEAGNLGMDPKVYLERRREGAREDLRDHYEDLMDEAATDRAVERLEARLDRSLDRLDLNYDRRLDRLESRLDRENGE